MPNQVENRAEILRPTQNDTDIFAGRNFWQWSAESQELPRSDRRHRVTHSSKFYVLQLIGSWVHVSESAERTVKYERNTRWVRFENKYYELRRADNMKPFLAQFISAGCYAYIGHKQVDDLSGLQSIQEEPFIYIASTAALRIFKRMRET